MGMETQARISSVRALEGTLRSAAAMAHGVSLASGNAGNVAIVVDGVNVAMVNGYPTTAAIVSTIDNSVIGTEPGKFTRNGGVFTLNGATSTLSCRVTYVQSAGANLQPAITPLSTTC
jgi:MSHA pilin protein MshA